MIYVRFELADGLHMNGRPLPERFMASEVTMPDTPGQRVGAAQYPPTHQREFPELGVTLGVCESLVNVAIPVTPNAELLNWTNPDNPDNPEVIEVPGRCCSRSAARRSVTHQEPRTCRW